MSTQNQENKKRIMTLTIITPNTAPVSVECDSVHLTAEDNAEGSDGGLYGIRPGHAPAIIALAEGKLEAFLSGEKVMSTICMQGFARVSDNKIIITAESVK